MRCVWTELKATAEAVVIALDALDLLSALPPAAAGSSFSAILEAPVALRWVRADL